VQNTNQGAAVIDRKGKYSLRIEILAYLTCILRPTLGGFLSEYCHAVCFGVEKLKWYGYTMMMKNFEDIFIRFDVLTSPPTNGSYFCASVRTDAQRLHDGIGRAYA